jgi:hypothetical protein
MHLHAVRTSKAVTADRTALLPQRPYALTPLLVGLFACQIWLTHPAVFVCLFACQIWLTHPAVQGEPMAFECRWAELRSAVRLSHGSAAKVECRFSWERINAATVGSASEPPLCEAEPIPNAAASVYVPALADVGCCLRATCHVVVCHGTGPTLAVASKAAPKLSKPTGFTDGAAAEAIDLVGSSAAKASEGLADVVIATGWLVSAPVLQAAPFIKTLSLHGEPIEGEVNRIVFSTRTE